MFHEFIGDIPNAFPMNSPQAKLAKRKKKTAEGGHVASKLRGRVALLKADH
jgi:hypothetical protein